MIQERILELTEYGLVTGLVEPEDRRFTINRLLELFHLDELEDEVAAAYAKRTPMTQESAEAALEGILNEMLDYAAEDGLMPEDTITYRDLFDTKIMSMLLQIPSLEHWISPSISPNRKKIRRRSQQPSLQNRAVIQNAFCAKKTRDMQDV